MGRPRKPLKSSGFRGFESHAFRQYVHGRPRRFEKRLLSRCFARSSPWTFVDVRGALLSERADESNQGRSDSHGKTSISTADQFSCGGGATYTDGRVRRRATRPRLHDCLRHPDVASTCRSCNPQSGRAGRHRSCRSGDSRWPTVGSRQPLRIRVTRPRRRCAIRPTQRRGDNAWIRPTRRRPIPPGQRTSARTPRPELEAQQRRRMTLRRLRQV